MNYTPNFAISFINTQTGNGLIDCGTNDLKTAKGAARNWYKNVGHVMSSWFRANSIGTEYGENIKIIVRPIDCPEDAINMSVTGIQANKFLQREERSGATVLSFDDLF